MRRVWIGNTYNQKSFGDTIEEILGKSDFDVELFGVGINSKQLPDNFDIVDYGSRETLALVRDGEVIDDREEIGKILDAEAC